MTSFKLLLVIFVIFGSVLCVNMARRKRQASNIVNTNSKSNQNLIVEKHNILRKELTAANILQMVWDDEAKILAQQWLAESNCHLHRVPSKFKTTSVFSCGQNYFRSQRLLSWERIISKWWKEIDQFEYDKASRGPTSNFTQMAHGAAWKIGCAHRLMTCSGSRYHVYLCNYCPGLPRSKQRTPYIEGEHCGQCSGSCDDGFCTNPCGLQNKLDNCENLQQSFNICDNPGFEEDVKECPATCQCGDAIY